MTKAEQFLWIVQSVILANAVNLARREPDPNSTAIFSATGTFGTAEDAIWASERIPDDMTASQAANEFITYSLRNLREAAENAHGTRLSVPHWYARG